MRQSNKKGIRSSRSSTWQSNLPSPHMSTQLSTTSSSTPRHIMRNHTSSSLFPSHSNPPLNPNRRAFLRGLGASLALPWLESTHAPVYAQATAPLHRFLAFYVPNGFNMSQFWPAQTGALSADALQSTSLASLSAFSQKLLLINGLDNHAASAQGDGPGDHARGTSTVLTCTHPLKSADQLRNGVSLDQLLAQQYANQTLFPSLELGCEGGGNAGGCDSGYSCAYSRNIAWADEQTPLPKEVNPRLLFNRLFGNLDPNQTPEAQALRRRRRQSVLDFVIADAQRLRARISASDHHRVDAYLTGIREVERRLQNSTEDSCSANQERPQGVPADRQTHAELLLDLMVAAFRCDLTRVGTFMLGNGGSNRVYSELNISEGHHALSHHQNDANKLLQIAQIDAYEISFLARLLNRLQESSEGQGSLLDHTTVLFSSECADGNSHAHYEMPLILAGRVGSYSMGQYHDLRAPQRNNQPLANLYLSILHDAGRMDTTFGDDGTQALVL